MRKINLSVFKAIDQLKKKDKDFEKDKFTDISFTYVFNRK